MNRQVTRLGGRDSRHRPPPSHSARLFTLRPHQAGRTVPVAKAGTLPGGINRQISVSIKCWSCFSSAYDQCWTQALCHPCSVKRLAFHLAARSPCAREPGCSSACHTLHSEPLHLQPCRAHISLVRAHCSRALFGGPLYPALECMCSFAAVMTQGPSSLRALSERCFQAFLTAPLRG